MIAVLSATEHDYYAMPLPFAVFSWVKMGIRCVCFIPDGDNVKLSLAKKYCGDAQFATFNAEEKRIPTYSQVSRLFAAALDLPDDKVLITSDSDMCVFGDFFNGLDDGNIHIVGHDLTPDEQYPMCYAAMPRSQWRKIFNITKTYQSHLEEIINPIEGDNIRGTNWCLDQFLLRRELDKSGIHFIKHPRSNGLTQWATKRADRDGWHFDPYDIIDAHLPRPLTDDENFRKVYDLFRIKYPHDNLDWMIEYQQAYKQLL